MARLPALLLAALPLALALAGCAQREPVTLQPVQVSLPKERALHPAAPPGGSHAPPANDCRTELVHASGKVLGRINCTEGSGTAALDVGGCGSAPGSDDWLSVETAEGRIGEGNATATATAAGAVAGTLRVDAATEEGKETLVADAGTYHLTLDLQGWSGEWVLATVECAAA